MREPFVARLWRIRYQSMHTHGGYYKFVHAWTRWGALRLGKIYRHSGWKMNAERWRG